MSSFSYAWTAMAVGSGFDNDPFWALPRSAPVFPAPAQTDYLMEPMRYELGKPDVTRNSVATRQIGWRQRKTVVSGTSPPLDGHLDSTTVTSVDIPMSIFHIGAVSPGSGATWRGIELFRNGVSLGLQTFSRGLDTRIGARYSTTPQRFVLSSPVSVIESDTWYWDVYVRVTCDYSAVNPAWAENGSGLPIGTDGDITFQGTTTVVGESTVEGLKYVFGSNGPGGVTELTIATQTGWTKSTVSTGVIRMLNTAGTILIDFNWNQEIPYVRYLNTAKNNDPALMSSEMMYRPADSGDYLSLYNATGDITFGKWSPASATVFDSMWRYREFYAPQPYSHCIPTDSFGTGFPSSITVEPA